MKRFAPLGFLCVLLSCALSGQPTMTPVLMEQVPGTKEVRIVYDLAHSTGLSSTVTVQASQDGGGTFFDLASVSGAVGAGVAPGTSREILWQAGQDWPSEPFPGVIVRLTADDGRGGAAPAGMVRIDPGTFIMGSPVYEPTRWSDETQHEVTLTQAFYLQATEVTKAQWEAVRAQGPARGYTDLPDGREGYNGDGSGEHPVTSVSWFDGVKWLNLKSELEGLRPCYTVGGTIMKTGQATPVCDFNASGYRLPTESEWEYAARAGTATAFYSGPMTHQQGPDPNLEVIGWYWSNSGGNTHPVGQKQPNAWGLYDMSGNVNEWCWDGYGSYPGAVTDPTGADSGALRVFRGGTFFSPALRCRTACRYGFYPGYRSYSVGFRPARMALHSVSFPPFDPDLTDPPPPVALYQPIDPGPLDYRVFGGTLGHDGLPFALAINLTPLALRPDRAYFIEFELDPDSTSLWRRVKEDILSRFGYVEPNRWRMEIDPSENVAIVDEGALTAWNRGSSLGWTGYTQGMPLSEWPAGYYTYTVYQGGFFNKAKVGEGTFILNILKPRHGDSFTTRPVVLLHGYASDARFFADPDQVSFDSSQSIGGRMAAGRPTYTLEVPNISDLEVNAAILGDALREVSAHHGWPASHVIGHSMGGVIARYYKQFIPQEDGDDSFLKKVVSLGSPFEGTLPGDDKLLHFMGHNFAAMALGLEELVELPRGPYSVAGQQLANPQQAFPGFWRNDDARVTGDSDFLAVCGTHPWGLELMPAAITPLLSQMATVQDLKQVLNQQLVFARRGLLENRSDGLAAWESSGKRPLDQHLNLYVYANHTGYNDPGKNRELDRMLSAIEGFLDDADLSEFLRTSSELNPRSPLSDTAVTTLQIRDVSGKAVTNAMVGILDTRSNTVALVSTLSDRHGSALVPSRFNLLPQEKLVPVGLGILREELFISANGSEGTSIQQIDTTSSREVRLPGSVVVAYDDTYTGPRNEGILINNGDLTTGSLGVALTLMAERAVEMQISEAGLKTDWIPFATSHAHTLADASPGPKTLFARFRNADGTDGTAVSATILYEPDVSKTGSLRIKDGVGESILFINGQRVDFKTPAHLPGLPEGIYAVTLFQDGVEFISSTLTAQITANQETTLFFEPINGGLWADAERYANGWSSLPWFGYFAELERDWIYHLEHGYQYCVGESVQGIHLYDLAMQSWFWISHSLYPYFYKSGANEGWYWYYQGGTFGQRWFYRMADQKDLQEHQINDPLDPLLPIAPRDLHQ